MKRALDWISVTALGVVVAASIAFGAAMMMGDQARAQATGAVGLPMVPRGHCQLAAIAAATALSACAGGIPSDATAVMISVETTAARWRDDGTNPTATVGMPIALASPMFYTGTLSKFVIVPQSATSTIDVAFYRLAAP